MACALMQYTARSPKDPHLCASRLVRLRLILALQRIDAIDEFHNAALMFGGRGQQLRVLRVQRVAFALPRILELPVHAAVCVRGNERAGAMMVQMGRQENNMSKREKRITLHFDYKSHKHRDCHQQIRTSCRAETRRAVSSFE